MFRRLMAFYTIALAVALAGCAGTANKPSARQTGLVPGSAQLAASGKPGIAHFTSGGLTVYVVDETAGSLVFSGKMPDDAQVVIRVDPDAGAVVAQGADPEEGGKPTILAKPIDKMHTFSIWTTAAAEAPDDV